MLDFLPVGEIKGFKHPGRHRKRTLAGDTTESSVRTRARSSSVVSARHYLNIFIYQVLLDAKASEQSARMVAMKNATDNADDLIKDLTLEYNKLRQGNITKELLEIAGGQWRNDRHAEVNQVQL